MKRLLDLIFSIIALILLSPLLAVISLVILIIDGRPIVYKQYRVGKDEKVFKIRKFRTMRRDAPEVAKAELENADSMLTKCGKFLRRTSLDELPQLMNIIEGTMSVVGPRPLIPQEREIRRLRSEMNIYSVRPGLTGWAQINGRDILSVEEKVNYDREYIEKRSLLFDTKIFILTIFKALGRKDIVDGRVEK